MAALTSIITATAAAYGAGSMYEADKQRTEARKEEKEAIAGAKVEALEDRKTMINKQRMQLMGAGDEKYTTKRTVGVKKPIPTGEEEVLG